MYLSKMHVCTRYTLIILDVCIETNSHIKQLYKGCKRRSPCKKVREREYDMNKVFIPC